MRKTFVFMLVFVLALACSPAFAQMHSGQGGMMNGQGYYGGNQGQGTYQGQGSYQGMPYGMGYGWGYQQMTPEQQQAYQAIQKKYESLDELMDKVWAKRSLLNAELAQANVDGKKVVALAEDLGKMMSELCVQNTKMIVEMREKGLPYYGMGWMHGGMMGYGSGYGMGYGYGMMGPGMMGGYWGGHGHMMGGW